MSLNLIQLFGAVLLGGLVAGEVARRGFGLPRTTGFVALGLLVGESGLQWIGSPHVEAAQVFIDLALGLILFELGYLIPPRNGAQVSACLRLAGTMALAVVASVSLVLVMMGFSGVHALMGGLICLVTSPAITVATTSDVGAKGPQSDWLYTFVAIHGCLAYLLITLLSPFAVAQEATDWWLGLTEALVQLGSGVLMAGVGAGVILMGARWLGRNAGQQHLLILGVILVGVGTAILLGLSAMFPMLICGVLVRHLDRAHQVTPIRIASDARIFLVITFVLAGAVLNASLLLTYWREALALAACRFLGQYLVLYGMGGGVISDRRSRFFMAVGLQPMSSVAVVLLASHQDLSSKAAVLAAIVQSAILLMQLLGPLATQTAVKGWGEATGIAKRV